MSNSARAKEIEYTRCIAKVERDGSFVVKLTTALTISITLTLASAMFTISAQAVDAKVAWTPWLTQASDLPATPPPPDPDATQEELTLLADRVAGLSDEARANVRHWQPGSANYRWMQMALDHYAAGPPSPMKSRGIALLNVAIYDAMAIAGEEKLRHRRLRPTGIATLGSMPQTSSYPSGYAAAATAAAGVMAYLFPDDTERFASAANRAGQARVDAGINFPSDVEAGAAIGRAVTDAILRHARSDGSDVEWAGERPTGPDKLQGEVFVYPGVGNWRPWVIASLDDYLPPPPPAIDSVDMTRELDELKAIDRNVLARIQAWSNHATTSAFQVWYERIATAVFEADDTLDPRAAAHAYASISVANHDAIIACFGAKYTYWMIRPNQLDDALPSLFPNPPHPSYPAAHSCSSTSYAVTIGHYFPTHAQATRDAAEAAGISRLIAGIHYPSDKRAGDELGEAVARTVIAHSQTLMPNE